MTQPKYNHKAIDAKWQKFWEDQKVYNAKLDPKLPKYYILSMLPYPSGAGLHVGHVTGYTAADIIARYKWQKGFNVLHPMGWDSFGLPAEQYAMRTGTHPAQTTVENINTYRRQLKSLGFSYDWDREVTTSSPEYYKWTQWIFTKLFERGLAYEAEILVNYCPAMRCVLANEEVENGQSIEGGHPVERRPLRQWILKITEYAEQLLADLDDLDWPEHLKRIQRAWIGKSQGAQITFLENATNQPIDVYTTRQDTFFGVSFLVLSPEHPLLATITTSEQKPQVEAYKKQTAAKSDLERTDLNKDKSGVFTGAYAQHPATGDLIPIWVADYVLMGYGTGAVMGVPAHDDRDFEFARKYQLTVKPVYDLQEPPEDMPADLTFEDVRLEVLAGKRCVAGQGLLINSGPFDGLAVFEAKEKIADWLETNKCGKRTTSYKLRDWIFSRQRYWGEPIPILHFEDGTKRALELDELPLTPPELSDYKPAEDGNSPLAKVSEWVEIIDPKTGKKALRETNTMPQWAGSCWYYIRYCDPQNDKEAWSKQAENYWLPVDMYIGGIEHAVLHLLYARFWHKVLYDLGYLSTKEPFKALRNQGLVTSIAYKFPEGGYADPHEVEKREGECFHIPSGKQVMPIVEKMSKSKLNGVTPDEIVSAQGADTLRLYEMFMGPFDKEKLWDSEAVSGCQRFLNRFWELVTSEQVSDLENIDALKLAHKLAIGVEKDIEHMLYNTAISKM
ncbi:MAG TPA: leucine--tRNA ligase, partial [Chlamydiales bacterium]|nr:leucine--tRNA ligase [Chlamydiales bacterium]